MLMPELKLAEKLIPVQGRAFIGACGFEQRSTGWILSQIGVSNVINKAMIIHYKPSKGRGRCSELNKGLSSLGVSYTTNLIYNSVFPHCIEDDVEKKLDKILDGLTEVVIDISAMTKLLIMVLLDKLKNFDGVVRIVYTEAKEYAPTQKEYENRKDDLKALMHFPSRGFQSVVRVRCLSSIRMQGQPIVMVAFTSFNEQLVPYMLGSINPHKLIFINGCPPRSDYVWREHATSDIYRSLIDEYSGDNIIDVNNVLSRKSSTLYYKETLDSLEDIYKLYGAYERIICAATGSKMQTVGLFFFKMKHPDIHIEYPTPDSYYVHGMSKGIREIHEIFIPNYKDFIYNLANSKDNIANDKQ
jgi:hypothetical protein